MGIKKIISFMFIIFILSLFFCNITVGRVLSYDSFQNDTQSTSEKMEI